jgi:hypothetical protein
MTLTNCGNDGGGFEGRLALAEAHGQTQIHLLVPPGVDEPPARGAHPLRPHGPNGYSFPCPDALP